MINLRKIGREILSPHKLVIDIIDDFIKKNNIDLSLPILDFGSGTLIYSEILCQRFNATVYAYDISYRKKQPKTDFENIKICTDYESVMSNKYSFVFTCDVLHHVNKNELIGVMNKFTEISSCVIIKDVDCNDKLGYLQSKIHDFIFSHQIINDIYADKMEKFFIDKDYKTQVHNIKKYGYPNFLLLANRWQQIFIIW